MVVGGARRAGVRGRARGCGVRGAPALASCRPCLVNTQAPKQQGELVWVRNVCHLTKIGVLVVHQNQIMSVSVGDGDLIIPQSFTHHVLLQHSGPRAGILQQSGARRQGCNGCVVSGPRRAGVRDRARGCGVRGAPERNPLLFA